MDTSIGAVAAFAALAPEDRVAPFAAPATPALPASASGGFADVMRRELGQLDAAVGAAESTMRDVAAGKPVELHDAMIKLEQARLSVQTFVQVRNKLVESYQDLMRMQL